jgi:tetratricopeptide (TPR) repeat protein
VALTRRLRESGGEDRLTVAALGAVLVAFAFGAGIDWMWELTVVAVVAIVALGVLAGPAARRRALPPASSTTSRMRRWAPRLALVLAGLGLVVAQAIPFASAAKVAESQKQAAKGDLSAALADANSARDIQPWASSPYLQLALVRQELGQPAQSGAAIRHAISNDPADWRLWLVAAGIERQAGDQARARRDLAQAASLNPRSPLFAQLRKPESRSGR